MELDSALAGDVEGQVCQVVVMPVEGLVDVLILAAFADCLNDLQVLTVRWLVTGTALLGMS